MGWVKKRRRFIKREDLLAFLCGKAPPPRIRPSQMGRSSAERSSPRSHTQSHDVVGHSVETTDDLQPFREALALQGELRGIFLPNFFWCCSSLMKLVLRSQTAMHHKRLVIWVKCLTKIPCRVSLLERFFVQP